MSGEYAQQVKTGTNGSPQQTSTQQGNQASAMGCLLIAAILIAAILYIKSTPDSEPVSLESVFTPNELAYMAEFEQHWDETQNYVTRIYMALQNPLDYDGVTQWKATCLNLGLSILFQLREAKEMSPPDAFKESHSLYMASLERAREAVMLMTNVFDKFMFSHSELSPAIERLDAADTLLNEALYKMNSVKEARLSSRK